MNATIIICIILLLLFLTLFLLCYHWRRRAVFPNIKDESYITNVSTKEKSKNKKELEEIINQKNDREASIDSYGPIVQSKKYMLRKWRFLSRLFKKHVINEVYSSVFSPGEVKRATHMLVQVYLHLPEETNEVQTLAQEADKNAKRRDYIPLSIQLKKGDMVDVLFGIYGETLLMSEKKSVIWMGSFTKCTFVFYVSNDLDIEELSCMAMLSVNGVPAGEMRFITKVVDNPRQLNPEVFSKQYQKIFISYAHQDEPKVEQMARAYKAQGVDYFFDRHYLQPGDVFPLKIQEFIDSADLFILCWSANAANSDYVKLERKRALERAYPKIKPIEKAPLRIYPMSIEPRAELPEDMRDTYNFEII